jgi:hypothetical protein
MQKFEQTVDLSKRLQFLHLKNLAAYLFLCLGEKVSSSRFLTRWNAIKKCTNIEKSIIEVIDNFSKN